MSFIDKMKNLLGIPTEDDFEYEEDMPIVTNNKNDDIYYDEQPKKANKVVSLNTTGLNAPQIVLKKPEKFEEASSIADHLNDKMTVVLNLETTTEEVSRRLIDFLSGVAYANGGQVQRVSNRTFIITSSNVDVMGDLIDEIESSGVYY